MTDWADEKAEEIISGLDFDIAQTLREARAKGLEEAAQFVEIETKEFSLFMQTAAAIRKLKEQP